MPLTKIILEQEGFYESPVYIGYKYTCDKRNCKNPYCLAHDKYGANSFENRVFRYKRYYAEKRLRTPCQFLEFCSDCLCLKDHPTDNSTPYIRHIRCMSGRCQIGTRCVALNCDKIHRFEDTGQDTSLFERISMLQIYVNENIHYRTDSRGNFIEKKRCADGALCSRPECLRIHCDNSDVLIRLIRKEGFANVMQCIPPP